MNRQVIQSLLTAGLAVLLGSATLSASSNVEKANIPFAFQAGRTQAAAGTYVFSRNAGSDFFVANSQTSHFVMLGLSPLSGEEERPRLVFHCYGGECALSEIWTASGSGFRLGTSDFDRKMHRQVGFSPRVVYITFEPR